LSCANSHAQSHSVGIVRKTVRLQLYFPRNGTVILQDAQERTHIIRVGNAKERYLYFIEARHGFIDRLPIEHIASLLDMKPETIRIVIPELFFERKNRK
jgi:hypothetical protein